MMKLLLAATATASMVATPVLAQNGNGAPSGSHYTLNIIGVKEKNNMPQNLDSGHVIFVKLWGGDSKINLCNSSEAGACEGVGFQVLDKNGTDGEAAFALPAPDSLNTGTTVYSVFARALGKPGGEADMTTCATDPDLVDDVTTPNVDESLVCSVAVLELERTHGKQKFENVSKELLYIYADIDDDLDLERVPLFGDELEGFFWDYDNRGLRIAQLRFYPCETTVPDAPSPNDPVTSNCFD